MGTERQTAVNKPGAETQRQMRPVRIPIGVALDHPAASQGESALEGNLTIPAGARGIVLFAHGSGSSRHSPRNRFVAEIVHDGGIATLLFDLLTREEETADERNGKWRFNIELLAGRLVEATRWMANQPEIKRLGVGYFGASTGGAAALVAATQLGRAIDAVVLRGGRPDLAGDALERVRSATLMIVGERDETVLEFNQRALHRMQCERELKVIPRATHLFEEAGTLREVAHLATEWFNRHLRPRETRL